MFSSAKRVASDTNFPILKFSVPKIETQYRAPLEIPESSQPKEQSTRGYPRTSFTERKIESSASHGSIKEYISKIKRRLPDSAPKIWPSEIWSVKKRAARRKVHRCDRFHGAGPRPFRGGTFSERTFSVYKQNVRLFALPVVEARKSYLGDRFERKRHVAREQGTSGLGG